MQMGRDEAMSVLRTWAEDRTVLRCDVSFRVLAFRFTGRMTKMSDDDVLLLSEDKTVEFSFRVVQESEFGYGDMRSQPELSQSFVRSMVVFLPPVTDDGEFVSFTEVKE